MKILITGGQGFLGRLLAVKLSSHHQIYAPGRAQLDLCDANSLRAFFDAECFDAVIHCAAAGRNATRSHSLEIVDLNLRAFNNLVCHAGKFSKLINIASGAEFDLDQNIHLAQENQIWSCAPQHSYGLSKNIIARMTQLLPNAINLRLFGCFDQSESNQRPIKRCQELVRAGQIFSIFGDKFFDFVSVDDLVMMIETVLKNPITDKDINIVYNKKFMLSEILKLYCLVHKYDSNLIQVESIDENNYTGSDKILSQYALPMLGLERSLESYR